MLPLAGHSFHHSLLSFLIQFSEFFLLWVKYFHFQYYFSRHFLNSIFQLYNTLKHFLHITPWLKTHFKCHFLSILFCISKCQFCHLEHLSDLNSLIILLNFDIFRFHIQSLSLIECIQDRDISHIFPKFHHLLIVSLGFLHFSVILFT